MITLRTFEGFETRGVRTFPSVAEAVAFYHGIGYKSLDVSRQRYGENAERVMFNVRSGRWIIVVHEGMLAHSAYDCVPLVDNAREGG